MTWTRGQETIRRLVQAHELETIVPSTDFAMRHLEEASKHVRAAAAIVDFDVEGAFQLAYDAVRKASAGLLAEQGLRGTRQGGHVAVQDAVRDQFNGPGGEPVFGEMSRLRRVRNAAEYPNPGAPPLTAADARDAIDVATRVVEASQKLLDAHVLTPF